MQYNEPDFFFFLVLEDKTFHSLVYVIWNESWILMLHQESKKM